MKMTAAILFQMFSEVEHAFIKKEKKLLDLNVNEIVKYIDVFFV